MKTPSRSVNNIEENKTQLQNTTDVKPVHNSDVNFISQDYYVIMTSEGDESSNSSVDEKGDPKYLFVKFGNSEFNIMVDTGSVVSLITKRIAQENETHYSSAWWGRQPNSIKLESFNNSPIKNLGNLYCEVQSNS